jgi:hypothetical protein
MQKSRLAAFLSLMLVFLSGAVLGVFVYRLYTQRTVGTEVARPSPPRRPDPEQVRKRNLDEMRDVLGLDERQLADLKLIYDETQAAFDKIQKHRQNEVREVWDAQVLKIKKILRPEQIPLYDQLREKHDRERKERRKQMGPPPDRK